jgi:glycosyltransferase involved in cell wall biosynthesis
MGARRRRLAHGKRALIVIENVSLARDHRARKQVDALRSDGYHVSVVCRRDDGNLGYRRLSGVRLYEYTGPREATSKIGFLWEYGYSLLAAFALCLRASVEHGFDFMQIGNPPDAQFLLALPFRLFGRVLIVDQRDLSPEVYRDRYGTDRGALWRLLCGLERRSWRAADHVITVNASLQQTIMQRGAVPREAVTIVGNGPCSDRTAPERPELKCGKRFLVMWLGLMGPQDHADLAIHAAHHIVRTFGRTECHFVFVGEGEALAGLRTLTAEFRMSEYVTFTGWLDEAECMQYLATADIGLDTNLQEEVTPVKGLEYMSFGLPMVAFDLSETRRAALDAATYVPAGDPLALARNVVELLDDPDRRSEMGTAGRIRIQDELAWEHQATRYLAVYAALGTDPRSAVRSSLRRTSSQGLGGRRGGAVVGAAAEPARVSGDD